MFDQVNDRTTPEENVDQHTIARFYLNLFSATTDKRVYVRERGGFAYGPKSTKTLTVEENAFGVFNGDQRDNSCDKVNSAIETRMAPHMQSLDPGKSVTNGEWCAVWLLTANFLARSRTTRDRLKEMMQWAALIAEDARPCLPVELATAPDDINRAADVLYPVMAVEGTESIALSLRKKGCDLFIAPPGSVFITSDDPALVYAGGQLAKLEAKVDFIEQPSVEVFMALKPEMACHWSAAATGKVRQITAEDAARRNQDLFNSCYNAVFGNRKSVLDTLTAAKDH